MQDIHAQNFLIQAYPVDERQAKHQAQLNHSSTGNFSRFQFPCL